jgi:hypothetical protein
VFAAEATPEAFEPTALATDAAPLVAVEKAPLAPDFTVDATPVATLPAPEVTTVYTLPAPEVTTVNTLPAPLTTVEATPVATDTAPDVITLTSEETWADAREAATRGRKTVERRIAICMCVDL